VKPPTATDTSISSPRDGRPVGCLASHTSAGTMRCSDSRLIDDRTRYSPSVPIYGCSSASRDTGIVQPKRGNLDHESHFFENFKRKLDSQTSLHIAQASCTSNMEQSCCNITSRDCHGTWALHAPSTSKAQIRSDRARATPRTPQDPHTK
jgi:hypothetical protein